MQHAAAVAYMGDHASNFPLGGYVKTPETRLHVLHEPRRKNGDCMTLSTTPKKYTPNVADIEVNMWDFNDKLVAVPMFQLLQFKHALRLESKGLKHSRGSVTAHVRRLLSAPKSYPRAALLGHITRTINDVNKQLGN